MKEIGENHMEDVMATTRTQAMHVRDKEERFKQLKASILAPRKKLPHIEKADREAVEDDFATVGAQPVMNVRILNDENSVIESVRGV